MALATIVLAISPPEVRAGEILFVAGGETIWIDCVFSPDTGSSDSNILTWRASSRGITIVEGSWIGRSSDSNASIMFAAPHVARASTLEVSYNMRSASGHDSGVLAYLVLPPPDTGAAGRLSKRARLRLYDPEHRLARDAFWRDTSIRRIRDVAWAGDSDLIILAPGALNRLTEEEEANLVDRVPNGLRILLIDPRDPDSRIWSVEEGIETTGSIADQLDTALRLPILSALRADEIDWVMSSRGAKNLRGIYPRGLLSMRPLLVAEGQIAALMLSEKTGRILFWRWPSDRISQLLSPHIMPHIIDLLANSQEVFQSGVLNDPDSSADRYDARLDACSSISSGNVLLAIFDSDTSLNDTRVRQLGKMIPGEWRKSGGFRDRGGPRLYLLGSRAETAARNFSAICREGTVELLPAAFLGRDFAARARFSEWLGRKRIHLDKELTLP